MKDIIIRFIKHKEQNYSTVGDYGEEKLLTWFSVSRLSDWRYMMLVAVHELIEYALVKFRGITIKSINKFDNGYEEKRPGLADCKCIITKDSEPGNDRHAPYYKEHKLATKIERMLAHELGVEWNKYDEEVNNL